METGVRLRGGEGFGRRETVANGDDEWKTRAWRGNGIDVLWFKDLDHAQVFDKPATRRVLIDAIRTYCQDE
jgi:hypothetical protein